MSENLLRDHPVRILNKDDDLKVFTDSINYCDLNCGTIQTPVLFLARKSAGLIKISAAYIHTFASFPSFIGSLPVETSPTVFTAHKIVIM